MQLIAEILKICYFVSLWACPAKPGHAHPKYDNQPLALMGLYPHAKNQADILYGSWDIQV